MISSRHLSPGFCRRSVLHTHPRFLRQMVTTCWSGHAPAPGAGLRTSKNDICPSPPWSESSKASLKTPRRPPISTMNVVEQQLLLHASHVTLGVHRCRRELEQSQDRTRHGPMPLRDWPRTPKNDLLPLTQ